MKRIVLAAAIAVACTGSALSAGAERTIAGQAQVIDGDSLVVSGMRIRILDVDAPESGQFCFAPRARASIRARGIAASARPPRSPTGSASRRSAAIPLAKEFTRAGWRAVQSRDMTWRSGSRPTAGRCPRPTASVRSCGPPRTRRGRRGWASGPAPSRCRGSGARPASGFPSPIEKRSDHEAVDPCAIDKLHQDRHGTILPVRSIIGRAIVSVQVHRALRIVGLFARSSRTWRGQRPRFP